jgi:hypothetical protein
MRTIRLMALAAVASVTATALVSATWAGADDDHSRTIRVQERNIQEADIDLGEPDFSAGDQFVFRGELYDRDDDRVGISGGVCTFLAEEAAGVDAQCVATFRLDDGQITVQGLITFTEEDRPFQAAITGGTGDYRNAHGQVRIVNNADGTVDYTIRLS